ncbi:MAG: inositol monophosphatase [Bacteroidetes bacterium]|nr:inositol monophosphatase [Bacteroidota bacterium]
MSSTGIINEAINITLQTGKYLLAESKNFNQNAIEVKSLNQLVSYVDITAEKMLVEGLNKILPEAGFITEEKTINKLSENLNWIIDPLDGTTNFMHGVPVFAVSVALYNKNEPLLGIVFDVCNNQLFWADNSGAFCNDEKITVSANYNLSKSLLATGFPYYDFDGMKSYLDTLKTLMKHTRGLRRLGSAAIDLAYVACGKFEGFFEYGLQPWDVAAGAFIIEKAGGRVCDFNGKQNWLFGKEIIASNSKIFNTYFEIINSNFIK